MSTVQTDPKGIKQLVYSALLLALGLILPFVTGQIPQIGKMLLPMHIPVLLCGVLCGPLWGAGVGFATPLIRSLVFGQPVLLKAFSMSFELLGYGFFFGFFCRKFPDKLPYCYLSLLLAQVLGRILYAIVQFILLGFGVVDFSFAYFWTGTILEAIPGIVLQFILIPPLAFFARKRQSY